MASHDGLPRTSPPRRRLYLDAVEGGQTAYPITYRQCIEYRRAAVLLSMQSQWRDNARIFFDFSENVRFSGIFFSATAEDFSKILEQDCSLDIQSIRYYF